MLSLLFNDKIIKKLQFLNNQKAAISYMCGHYVTVNSEKHAIIFHLNPCHAEYFFIHYTLSQFFFSSTRRLVFSMFFQSGKLWILIRWLHQKSSGPRREKTCLRGLANNKDAAQPAHQRSLISASVIHLLGSIISGLATREISIF